MAINANSLRHPSDKSLFYVAAIGFPLLVLIGYFKTYYFSRFFSVNPVANNLVHAHAVIMTTWVVYFTALIWLVRSKNTRLHMTLGMAGVVLATLVVVVGMWPAVDAHLVRRSAPAGISPYGFFAIPLVQMIVFAALFAAAIFYRKSPVEHKSLMLLTAINFLPAAFGRIPLLPAQFIILQSFGVPAIIALFFLAWHAIKHRRLNKIFSVATLLMIASFPLQVFLALNQKFIELVARLVSQT